MSYYDKETRVGEDTIEVSTIKGCPQGGILAILMWSLVFAELLERLCVGGFTFLGYAGDTVYHCQGKSGRHPLLQVDKYHKKIVRFNGAQCEFSIIHPSTIYEKNQTPRSENS